MSTGPKWIGASGRPYRARMSRLFRLVALLAVALLPLGAGAQGRADAQGQFRRATSGFAYVGAAPGANFGGESLPRTLYVDFVHGGYVFASGLDVSLALSGTNLFPSSGEYSVSMGRLSVGFRPFLKDPLPMIQPYGFVGTGIGGEGLYRCEPKSSNPEKDLGQDVCNRAHWAGDFFVGAGVDFNSFLFYVGGQQVLFYAGLTARYEFLRNYQMPVVTVPFGLRIQ